MFALLLSISAAVAVAKGTWNSPDYSFEKYMGEYGLKFEGAELEERRGMFETELKRVRDHNNRGLSWTEGMNKFSVMTAKEKSQHFGRSKGMSAVQAKTQKHMKTVEGNLNIHPVSSLPDEVDWRKNGIISPVKDQGHCGSCWAFASTAVIESYVALNSGLLFELSPEQIAMCAPNPNHCGGTGGCEGSTAELAFEYLSDSDGIFEEFQYPYMSYDGTDYDCNTAKAGFLSNPKGTINGYVHLPNNNYTALMNAVATAGPIAINVDASTWHAYEGGVFDGCNQANPDVNHVVVMVGYGEENGQKYWLVRNSWSPSYGEGGYIKLARSDDDDKNCGSDVTPQDGVACSDQVEPVTVCGTCGAIYDSSYPLLADAL